MTATVLSHSFNIHVQLFFNKEIMYAKYSFQSKSVFLIFFISSKNPNFYYLIQLNFALILICYMWSQDLQIDTKPTRQMPTKHMFYWYLFLCFFFMFKSDVMIQGGSMGNSLAFWIIYKYSGLVVYIQLWCINVQFDKSYLFFKLLSKQTWFSHIPHLRPYIRLLWRPKERAII